MRCGAKSVPETSFATDSTEPRLGNAVDTGCRRVCGKTFSSTKCTPYYRLQHGRATFDGVIALRVDGVSISSISRIDGDCLERSSTEWLEKAAQVCPRFNHTRIAGFAAEQLPHQADEIRTFAGSKKTPSCVFVTIEVWARL